ncbi:MAG: acyl-CoA dehydrogenase family protein [Thermoplasmata archaeon]
MENDNESYKMLRASVKKFVENEVEPIRTKIDQEDFFPMELFKKMGELGYLGVTIPEEYGGSNFGYMAQAIIEEELGYSSPSLALSYGAHSNLCLDNAFRNGSKYIRENYVPKLASGEYIGSLCLTEPNAGSDALALSTTLKEENGTLVLNGSKTFITNAPYADFFLVYAKDSGKYSAVAVLSTDEGLERGKKFEKMGMRGSPTGEVIFNNIKIPENRFIGSRYTGKEIIMSGLNSERVILAFIFVGLARRALDEAVKYSTERKQFSQPLYEFELIQEKLSYMYVKYQTSKLLAYKALERLHKDMMDPLDAASAIMYASETAEYIAREAIQIFGGYGYIKDTGIEVMHRDAILGQIGAGTTEIRKHVIAKSLVKHYMKDGSIDPD